MKGSFFPFECSRYKSNGTISPRGQNGTSGYVLGESRKRKVLNGQEFFDSIQDSTGKPIEEESLHGQVKYSFQETIQFHESKFMDQQLYDPKEAKRRESNRQNAARSRSKQKNLVHDLLTRANELEKMANDLKMSNTCLQSRIELLQTRMVQTPPDEIDTSRHNLADEMKSARATFVESAVPPSVLRSSYSAQGPTSLRSDTPRTVPAHRIAVESGHTKPLDVINEKTEGEICYENTRALYQNIKNSEAHSTSLYSNQRTPNTQNFQSFPVSDSIDEKSKSILTKSLEEVCSEKMLYEILQGLIENRRNNDPATFVPFNNGTSVFLQAATGNATLQGNDNVATAPLSNIPTEHQLFEAMVTLLGIQRTPKSNRSCIIDPQLFMKGKGQNLVDMMKPSKVQSSNINSDSDFGKEFHKLYDLTQSVEVMQEQRKLSNPHRYPNNGNATHSPCFVPTFAPCNDSMGLNPIISTQAIELAKVLLSSMLATQQQANKV